MGAQKNRLIEMLLLSTHSIFWPVPESELALSYVFVNSDLFSFEMLCKPQKSEFTRA